MKAWDAVLLIVVQRSTVRIVQNLHLWVCDAPTSLGRETPPIYPGATAECGGLQPKDGVRLLTLPLAFEPLPLCASAPACNWGWCMSTSSKDSGKGQTLSGSVKGTSVP